MSTTDTHQFEELLEYLRQTHGFDFTAYKRSSLMRRVSKRMQTVNVQSFDQYHDYLQVHPEEFAGLFNTILINVTSFFRDPEVWEALHQEILPPLLKAHGNGAIRVWSAGCATGQEPYSLAIVLAELLGPDVVRDRVKIYATDIDDEALAVARAAVYSDRDLEGVNPDWIARYFEPIGSGRQAFSRELRRAVIFGRHDLLSDAPISRVDLLLCRNTLMYFTSDAQARVLGRFYYSLNSASVVVLGRAEMLFSHSSMFTPIDLKRRLFRTVPKPAGRDRLTIFAQSGRDPMPDFPRLRDAAFESDATPQIVLDAEGVLAAANEPARARFRLTAADVGRPLQDLEVSYRPTDLRGLLDRALTERDGICVKDVHATYAGQARVYNVLVSPLYDEDRSLLGTRIAFEDVTEYKSLEVELQHSKQELETAYEELQSTNEELETTNEELQSTIEELETTNEELQSTNEELETMNEELQSANEELQTINDELRSRSTELNSANAFLESVFTSLRSGVVVLDREFKVQVWNHRAEDLWGVRPEEAQRAHFLSLDIGLPVAELGQPVRDVLSGVKQHVELVMPATSRRGKSLDCRITIAPLRRADDVVDGAILLMDERRDGDI